MKDYSETVSNIEEEKTECIIALYSTHDWYSIRTQEFHFILSL